MSRKPGGIFVDDCLCRRKDGGKVADDGPTARADQASQLDFQDGKAT
ncbi:hypothetical protein RvY_14000 [Ramazzottius varieornatus]|uniref:Uncharacterized protein n=1 Tax=Ramazzottius varieornatus TaxID=947166 RepID=A0A1D1VX60_RAMVA|nr:hypothetical protein RvY_14000 [Ramazzottius varieornatus]